MIAIASRCRFHVAPPAMGANGTPGHLILQGPIIIVMGFLEPQPSGADRLVVTV